MMCTDVHSLVCADKHQPDYRSTSAERLSSVHEANTRPTVWEFCATTLHQGHEWARAARAMMQDPSNVKSSRMQCIYTVTNVVIELHSD